MKYSIEKYPLIETLIENLFKDIDRGFHTSVFTFGEDTEHIIKALLNNYEDIKISMIDFDDIDYCNEYEISVFTDDNNIKELFVEPCLRKSGYYNSESDVAYVDENCDDDLLKHITSHVIIFSIED